MGRDNYFRLAHTREIEVMQNQLKELVDALELAGITVDNGTLASVGRTKRMSYLAKKGAAKRKLRREMDRVEKKIYGGLREEVL
jgi:hypothetical protein